MGVQIKKDSIDLGIITRNAEPLVAFYRDVVGLKFIGEVPMPGGVMHRLTAGTSVIKVYEQKGVTTDAVPGGIRGACGYRYWTITVSNLEEIAKTCEDAGHKVVVPIMELPGMRIAIVEDPDGNWVEFLEEA